MQVSLRNSIRWVNWSWLHWWCGDGIGGYLGRLIRLLWFRRRMGAWRLQKWGGETRWRRYIHVGRYISLITRENGTGGSFWDGRRHFWDIRSTHVGLLLKCSVCRGITEPLFELHLHRHRPRPHSFQCPDSNLRGTSSQKGPFRVHGIFKCSDGRNIQ